MLRRLSLRDFVIVKQLEIDFSAGFTALTGETGAGKSILIDALQLALGSRGDATVVREGTTRAEISAEFDTPSTLLPWLEQAGFEGTETLLLRRMIDSQGKSRAWVNGSSATVTQLRELADYLVDIHGQHAWQGLTRPVSVRDLLDDFAQLDSKDLGRLFAQYKTATTALEEARTSQETLARERERLAWQLSEIERLAPAPGEWETLNSEHQRLAHAQALLDACQHALQQVADNEDSAQTQLGRAVDSLQAVASYDVRLNELVEVLQGALASLQDASHSLNSYLNHSDLEPERLQELDERMSAWMGLARRYRRPPAELAALHEQWRAELQALDAASDLQALELACAQALKAYGLRAKAVSKERAKAAPQLASLVTQAMQQLGMAGGQFEVVLPPQTEPQSFGLESAELLVAGHAGSTPRPLGKVASGGELSRIALAVAVCTSGRNGSSNTLIFDEIDAGVGGAVAETVGRLMKQLGQGAQVLAVTHLPQVAACADAHFVVSKLEKAGNTVSDVAAVNGEQRVLELARMLGGERLSSASIAHAQEMLLTSNSIQSKPARKAKS